MNSDSRMQRPVLVLNTGSSSHKCCLFNGEKKVWQAHFEWKENFRDSFLTVDGKKKTLEISSAKDGLEKLLKTMPQANVEAVGHRVVHGGETFQKTVQIDSDVKDCIRDLSYLAPLHNPENLEGIEVAEKLFPKIPHFAVFDTAFHSTLDEATCTYPIPYSWREKSVRRYGFHGISHAYCTSRVAIFLKKDLKNLRVVNCHLGAGASLCAIKDGKSIDTTMGMTPLEGLMMASRSGTVDPGVLLYLFKYMKIKELDQILNKESGLLGISGISEDMRDIMEAAQKNHVRAKLAFEMFVHRLSGFIGQMIASLNGLDVLVFTAGIGEHAALVREKTCENFSFLGLKIDREKNNTLSHEEREISSNDSKVKVLIIPTQEEWEIAQECIRTLKTSDEII